MTTKFHRKYIKTVEAENQELKARVMNAEEVMESFKTNETRMLAEIDRLNGALQRKDIEIEALKTDLAKKFTSDIDPYINLSTKAERMPYHQQINQQTRYVPLYEQSNIYENKFKPNESSNVFNTPPKIQKNNRSMTPGNINYDKNLRSSIGE